MLVVSKPQAQEETVSMFTGEEDVEAHALAKHGWPPSVSCVATPTARASTASLSSHWRSPSCSPASSSTTESAGHAYRHQSAEALSFRL